MLITALPTIAQMTGMNRVLRGVSITTPTGDESLAPDDELALPRATGEPSDERCEPIILWDN